MRKVSLLLSLLLLISSSTPADKRSPERADKSVPGSGVRRKAEERPAQSAADTHVLMVGRAVQTAGFLTGDTALRVVHYVIHDIDTTVSNTFGDDVNGIRRTCDPCITLGVTWAFQDRVQVQACG